MTEAAGIRRRSELFERLSIPRLFWYCVLPGSVSMASSALYIVVDGMFVGHYLGHEKLALINMMWPLLMVCFALSDMISAGAAVQTAAFLGMKNRVMACRTFTCSIRIILGIEILAGTFCLCADRFYLSLMGADAANTELGHQYVRVYACCLPAVALFFTLDHYLRICGRQKMSMWLNVFVAGLNLLLDYIFIARLRCGIWSASFTTCASLCTGMLIALWPFVRHRLELRFSRGLIRWRQLGRMMVNGSAMLFRTLSASLVLLVTNTLLLRYGGLDAVGATAAVMYINSVVIMLLSGMNEALQPPISYCSGAGRWPRVAGMLRWLLMSSAAAALTVMTGLITCGHLLIPLYSSGDSPRFIEFGSRCVMLFPLCYICKWLELSLLSFLVAVEAPALAFVCSAVVNVGLPLAALGIMVPFAGLEGIWLSPAVASAAGSLVCAAAARRIWCRRVRSAASET